MRDKGQGDRPPGHLAQDLANFRQMPVPAGAIGLEAARGFTEQIVDPGLAPRTGGPRGGAGDQDRKSTRLNSSHVAISYAVFCLQKKKNSTPATDRDHN